VVDPALCQVDHLDTTQTLAKNERGTKMSKSWRFLTCRGTGCKISGLVASYISSLSELFLSTNRYIYLIVSLVCKAWRHRRRYR
jgi:hypothetical protein